MPEYTDDEYGPPSDEPNSMDKLQDRIRAWTERTFPDATPATAAAHLLSEATELFASLGGDPTTAIKVVAAALVKEKGDVRVETADVAILALDIAARSNFNLHDAIVAKQNRNEARLWGKANAHGFFEHTKEDKDGK